MIANTGHLDQAFRLVPGATAALWSRPLYGAFGIGADGA